MSQSLSPAHTIGNYRLQVPITSLNDSINYGKSALWAEIKNIRKADPEYAVIQQALRAVSWSNNINSMASEIVSYWDAIKANMNSNMDLKEDEDDSENNIPPANDMDIPSANDSIIPHANNIIIPPPEYEYSQPIFLNVEVSSINQDIDRFVINKWIKPPRNSPLETGLGAIFFDGTKQFMTDNRLGSFNLKMCATNQRTKEPKYSSYSEGGWKDYWFGNSHRSVGKRIQSYVEQIPNGKGGAFLVSVDGDKVLDARRGNGYHISYFGFIKKYSTVETRGAIKDEFNTFIVDAMNKHNNSNSNLIKSISQKIGVLKSRKNDMDVTEYVNELETLITAQQNALEFCDYNLGDADNADNENE